MTKLRKLTALLLAGVLTLLLLTACSGGGSSGPVAQAEADAVISQATTLRAAGLLDEDRLFTPEASRPTLIEAGYEVRFVPVPEEEYKKIEAEVAAGTYKPLITEAK